MKREDIEKAAKEFAFVCNDGPWQTKDLVTFAIERVNLALEEAREEISEAKDIENAMNIVDRLKIK